jgi:anti-anti-sigma factor
MPRTGTFDRWGWDLESGVMDSGLREGLGGPLRVSSAVRAGRTLVLVEGEVDFTTSPGLAAALDEAVSSGVGRVEVQLGGVSFCDCSCLNVLLAARERALAVGVIFACVTLSPHVQRVLELTQMEHLFRTA